MPKLEQGTTFDQRSTSVIKPAENETNFVSFEIAYKQLMSWEDPHMSGQITVDKGGKTRYGISENSHPSLDLNTLTPLRAKEITESDYWRYSAWDISRLPFRHQRLANKLLQFGFNTGVGTVIQLSNHYLNVIRGRFITPKLSDPLIVSNISDDVESLLLHMLVAAQLSRYVVDYHLLSRVPHSLMDRALSLA